MTTSVQAQCASDYTQLAALTRTCAAASPDSACTLDGQILSLDDIAQTDESLFIRFGSADNDVLDMIVFGRFRLTGSALIESLKIDVRNRTGYNVNLRSGPGTNFDEVGVLRFDAVYPADGRNDDGTWLRITRNEQPAWISADLVASVDTGNIMDLPVVSSAQGVLPRRRITLTEGRSNCSDELAGALLMADGAAQSIVLNDIPITVEGALLVLPRDDNLIFYGMTGTASVGGETVSPGTTIAMLPIDDPIMAIAFPPLNLIAALPIDPDVCLVGSDIPLRIYARPDTDLVAKSVSGDVVSLPISNYAMIGGERWWLAAEHVGWIAADTTETTDACMNVSEIDPPALETAGTSQPPTTVPFAGLSPEEVVIDY
ncbi:MAG: hypothetical protein KC547_19695, partial [Anaerolineae bacterium]|nr:hypothetical protein [Anaerolineae bacterium]